MTLVGVTASRAWQTLLFVFGEDRMKRFRGMKAVKMLAAGVILLQAGGCAFAGFLEFAQTVFLGITAAGAVAILQNI